MDISSMMSTGYTGMKPMETPVLSSAQNQSGRVTRQAVESPKEAERSRAEMSEKEQSQNVQQQADQAEEKKVDMDELANALNSQANSSLQFSVDEDTDRVVIKVVDKATQEVIKQFPSAEAMELAKNLGKFNGSLHKTQA